MKYISLKYSDQLLHSFQFSSGCKSKQFDVTTDYVNGHLVKDSHIETPNSLEKFLYDAIVFKGNSSIGAKAKILSRFYK